MIMGWMAVILFIAGLALLVLGGELLVRGASSLARAMNIAPLIVGLTVVAFGTSAPELAVSVRATLAGQGDIAVGNVVGSNIFNILVILGLSALASPLVVSAQLVRLDVPIMIGASLLAWLLARDGTISRLDGTLLFLGVVAYTTFLIRQGRRESRDFQAQAAAVGGEMVVHTARRHTTLHISLMVGGLVCLMVGAQWMVNSAVTFARAIGVSELIIGLTIVAAGTGLPEVTTSLVATLKGQRDIAVGNIVGSNIFNLLCILGLTGIVRPVPVDQSARAFDIPVMVAVALACLPIFFTGRRINRWEGMLFLAYYAAYTSSLILFAQRHAALAPFNRAMLLYVIPLTAVTLIVLAFRAWRTERATAATLSQQESS